MVGLYAIIFGVILVALGFRLRGHGAKVAAGRRAGALSHRRDSAAAGHILAG